jgi:hypothetical protein
MAKPSIHDELLRLAKRNDGVLTAEAVVEAARPESSPLHTAFTWDNDEAAEKWRLHQARNLILKINIETPVSNDQSITVRAWSSLTTDREEDGGGYRETIRVMRNGDQRRQLLSDALAEMERFAEKYRALTELAEVFEAIKRAKKSA